MSKSFNTRTYVNYHSEQPPRGKYVAYEEEDEYIPESFNENSIDDILNKLKHDILDKYSKRFRQIHVDLDDVRWRDHRLECEVYIYNGDVLKSQKTFEFYHHDWYWDESDYEQQINREIYEFVENLV